MNIGELKDKLLRLRSSDPLIFDKSMSKIEERLHYLRERNVTLVSGLVDYIDTLNYEIELMLSHVGSARRFKDGEEEDGEEED